MKMDQTSNLLYAVLQVEVKIITNWRRSCSCLFMWITSMLFDILCFSISFSYIDENYFTTKHRPWWSGFRYMNRIPCKFFLSISNLCNKIKSLEEIAWQEKDIGIYLERIYAFMEVSAFELDALALVASTMLILLFSYFKNCHFWPLL